MAAVSDISQLIRQVVPEENVVLASLRSGFFESEDLARVVRHANRARG